MKVSYWNWSCQIFPGFYCSVFSDPLDYEECQDGYYLDIVDYKKYMELVSEEYVNNIEFDDNPIDMQIVGFLGVDSPTYYNYSTDKIGMEIDVDIQALEQYCWVTCKDDFEDYLDKNWSSRSGFLSFIPNTLYKFKEEYSWSEYKRSELQEIMIEYYLLRHANFYYAEIDAYEASYELAYEAGVVLKDSNGNAYEYEYDNETDMIVPAGEPIEKVA